MTEGAENKKKTSEEQAIEAVSVPNLLPPDVIAMSTGVKLKCKQVPMGLLMKALSRFKKPEIPLVTIEGKTFRHAGDKGYLADLQAYNINLAAFTQDVLILKGTEVFETPKKFPGPKSNDWIEEMDVLGFEVRPDSTHWRYLNWINSVAAPLDTDVLLIQQEVGRLSGVSEADVEDASDFPESD